MTTLVIVENLVHGSRGQFRSNQSPESFTRFALALIRGAAFNEAAYEPEAHDYCDNEPVGVFIAVRAHHVLIRYHATGDTEAARHWLENIEHVREDGRLGVHEPQSLEGHTR
jgi:hypothetical protein